MWRFGIDDGAEDERAVALGVEEPLVLDAAGADFDTVGLSEGDRAPDFEFSTFEGERLRLSDYRGRTVFINFGATWCRPCRTELPDIEAVLDAHTGDGLVVIAVNNGDAFRPASNWIDDVGVRVTAYVYDPDQQIVRRYKVRGMPTSYFIDREGVITRIGLGQLSRDLMESAVRDALAGYSSGGR